MINKIEKFSTKKEKDNRHDKLENIKKWYELLHELSMLEESKIGEIGRGLIWRGMSAEEIIDFIKGVDDRIILDADKPNATTDWRKAISYHSDVSQLPFNAAIGFDAKNDHLKVKPAKDLMVYEGLPDQALKYQQDNYVINGEVLPNDLKYLLIRFHGLKPGHPGKLECFKVYLNKKENLS